MKDIQANRSKIFSRTKIFYYAGWLLFRLLGIALGMKRRGAENVPSSGAFPLASNHTAWP